MFLRKKNAPYSKIVAGNLLCSPDILCRHIGSLFGEGLDTLFASSNSEISGFTRPHVIGFDADFSIFFLTPESKFIFFRIRCQVRRMRVVIAVFGKKKLRIRKYPVTCGRGLKVLQDLSICITLIFTNPFPVQTYSLVNALLSFL